MPSALRALFYSTAVQSGRDYSKVWGIAVDKTKKAPLNLIFQSGSQTGQIKKK